MKPAYIMAGEEVYVDWRGNVVDERRHGGIRATLFLYVLSMLRSCASNTNFSLVAYFHAALNLDIVTSSTVICYLSGTVSIFTVLMNFISDAYMKRTTAIFVFCPCVVLGYMLLALQAQVPSLHPPSCIREPKNCEPAQGWNLILLCLSLLMFAIGEGCMRACIPFLVEEQFSNDDPKKSTKSMFLRWLKFANSLGAIIGLAFLVWIENNLGWYISFTMCALIVLVGLLVAASGMPFYRMQKPSGSLLARTLQVIVASSQKRQAAITNAIALQETGQADCVEKSGTTHCEETKATIQMLPIFISCLFIYLPFTLMMTLTIQVGSTMDRGAGVIQIPSASLIVIPVAFHMLMEPCYSYSRILAPWLRKITGLSHSFTPLQRIGAGSVCGTAAACVATLVETKRLEVAEQHRLISTETDVPMSIFWLVIQFFLLSIMDTASFGGLIEFINSKAPPTMKSLAPAVQSFLAGLAAWSCCAFIQLVNWATRHGEGGRGWLDGTNFNRTRLDHFFLLLAAFELVALINYTFWARQYTRKLQRISNVGLDDNNSRN